MTATKKGFSAHEMKRQLGHKRYQPIWAMMKKIRVYMGLSDEHNLLKGMIASIWYLIKDFQKTVVIFLWGHTISFLLFIFFLFVLLEDLEAIK